MSEETKPFERHIHYRDEQFWVTTATIGFNAFIMEKLGYWGTPAEILSILISLYGIHLILTRSFAHAVSAKRFTPPHFDNTKATAWERLRYTWWEIRTYVRHFGYTVSEGSSTFFYVILIAVSCFAIVFGYRW